MSSAPSRGIGNNVAAHAGKRAQTRLSRSNVDIMTKSVGSRSGTRSGGRTEGDSTTVGGGAEAGEDQVAYLTKKIRTAVFDALQDKGIHPQNKHFM